MPAAKRLVQRHPLAWGMTMWGPLLGTEDMWILWDGPGAGLYLHAADPSKGGNGNLGIRIRHASASGTYGTAAQAEKAVNAFVQAGIT